MTDLDARVELRPPPGWRVTPRAHRWTAESPTGLLAIEWSRLRPAPESERAWIVETLRAVAPRDGVVVLDRSAESETVDGWPVVLVAARFQRRDGSDAGAAHGAFYRFFALRGHAIAMSVSAAELAGARAAIDEALLAARPDLSRLFLGLCDFYAATPATER